MNNVIRKYLAIENQSISLEMKFKTQQHTYQFHQSSSLETSSGLSGLSGSFKKSKMLLQNPFKLVAVSVLQKTKKDDSAK